MLWFLKRCLLCCSVMLLTTAVCTAQSGGAIRGKVTVEGQPVHHARILIVQTGRSAETNDDGEFEFRNVPPGNYELIARATALSDSRRTIQVNAGEVATLDFALRIAAATEQVTVTATGQEQSAFESLQSTTSLEALELTQKSHTSLGEVLDNQPGVAKRSFGPGNSRPVLRGFDGDRVLVLRDGLHTGGLASQSGDHGENLDVLNLERVEVVRGPATLLYGSNAVGGVVSAITGQHRTHDHPSPGLSGYASGVAGSANYLGGGSLGLDYGIGKWVIRSGAGGQRTGDYDTPIGPIANSRSRNYNARGGFGYYGDKGFASVSYDYDNRRFGIPFAVFLESGGTTGPDDEVINLRQRSQDLKFSGGFQELDSFVTGIRANISYTHYRHGEFDGDALGTDFFNKQANYRVTFEQKKYGLLTGTWGFSGMMRDYKSVGAETLAPPTTARNFALFGLQTIGNDRISVQFGGRYEHTGYSPSTSSGLPDRTFNGFSGAVGVRVPLWKGGAFVTNFTHSYRAPALEELYNNGAHPGNLAFELGNPGLTREQGNGLEVSLRQQSDRFRATGNYFYYGMNDFVFLSPTSRVASGLFEAEYLQADARYFGGELSTEIGLHEKLWLLAGVDVVKARLSEGVVSPTTAFTFGKDRGLPRIPPARGRLGFDFRHKGFSLRPEAIFAKSQDDTFPNETRTAGYSVFNLGASYTIAKSHMVHVFSLNNFNLGDRLYRNHSSFIKNLAPEIGRGVRFGYTVRFF